jgi:2-polyprenyl-6-hydroxyphenyl methylase/3-demethylubiquinone-9 3-methyltransferase
LGHHWKEYSAKEIIEYFGSLSPDFLVRVRRTHYGPLARDLRRSLGPVRSAILRFGNATGVFADNLEVVISLPQKTQWCARAPAGAQNPQ